MDDHIYYQICALINSKMGAQVFEEKTDVFSQEFCSFTFRVGLNLHYFSKRIPFQFGNRTIYFLCLRSMTFIHSGATLEDQEYLSHLSSGRKKILSEVVSDAWIFHHMKSVSALEWIAFIHQHDEG